MSEIDLYETDLVLWTERQARLLREAAARGSNEPIDWEHGAEEVESLGRSERNDVASRVYVILVQLLKMGACPPRVCNADGG